MNPPIDDAGMERALGTILRLGVAVSAVCLALGLWRTLSTDRASGEVLLNAGVILLLATPALRVLMSIAMYIVQRDWLFAGLVAIVLLELLAGLIAASSEQAVRVSSHITSDRSLTEI